METELEKNHQGGGLKRLRCSVQNYDWGKKGSEGSEVARLYELNSGPDMELEKKPFAEFWMGTHGSGPSFVVESGVENADSFGSGTMSLKEWIVRNPNVLGHQVLDKWGCDLPFLFKVLSVAKALSIQAHPDKELAEVLHKLQPNLYKDDNHKPEMALAITEFEALCGFISIEELKGVLRDVPEIVELVGSAEANQVMQIHDQDHEEKVKSVLRSAFTQLMSASQEITAEAISKLKSRLYMESKIRQLTGKELLVLQLERQYPADIGVISAFFLNYRESSSSRFSGSLKHGSRKISPNDASRGGQGKGQKQWKDCDVIEEEGLLEDEERQKGLPRRCYFLAFVLGFFILFSFFSLILWGVSKPQKPKITMKSITFEQFRIQAGSDSTGVATDMISVNSTVKMTYRNKGTFFGVRVTSTPIDLSFSEITIASGNIKKFYQSRKSQRSVAISVISNKIPLYGSGAGLSSSTGTITLPVPLKMNFVIRSRAYVLGKLVRQKFNRKIECDFTFDPKKLNFPISLKKACTYD